MRLIELYIENFGKLSNYRYSFTQGLNVINEENGYGKSTLAAFIKSMLYGLEDTRRPRLDENDRKRYLPWQGGVFGGTLTFAVGSKKYRIERTFAPKAADDTFTLYDCESGKESSDYGSDLGEELFGINVDGFERTVFLSERLYARDWHIQYPGPVYWSDLKCLGHSRFSDRCCQNVYQRFKQC